MLCRVRLKRTEKASDDYQHNRLEESQVNNRFSDSVAQACDRHCADIVPTPLNRNSLYTYLSRKIYATISHRRLFPSDYR